MHPSTLCLSFVSLLGLMWFTFSEPTPTAQPERFRASLSGRFLTGLISTKASRPHPYLSKSTVVDNEAYAEHREFGKGSGNVEDVAPGTDEEVIGEEGELVKNKGLLDIELGLNGYASTQAIQEKYVRPQPFRRRSMK